MSASPIVALLAVILPLAPQSSHPDAEGFIRDWLVLAPIAIEGESGASEIDRAFLKGEAAITPTAGVTATVGGRTLTWKAHQTPEINNWQACARFTKSGAPVKVRISLAPQG